MEVEQIAIRRPLKRKGSFLQSAAKKPKFTRNGTLIMSSANIRPRRFNPVGLNQGNHGTEYKDNDVDITGQTFNTTGAILLLNGIAQGTDFTQREGRKFTMKSIYIRMIIQNGTTQVPNNVARWMIVYDKQPNGAAFTLANLLTAVATTAPNNLDYRDRFVVIWDKCHINGATGGNDNQKVFVKKYRRCNLETTNSGTGATVASIATGSLYFVSLGDVVAGTTASQVTAGTVRIRFVENK